nr:hypothetical protein [Tanacetum cinerariifolium]
TSGDAGTKSGRTVTFTTKDMLRKKNDTFNRLQVIVGQLQFIDVEIEQDDLNQKFLTSLAPEWLMHTIVWRNRSDLDTMSLDDLYNHLKDINQIDEDDIKEMDIKWSMALLRRPEARKEEGKTTIDRREDHALVADEEAPKEFALMANTITESKECIETLSKKLKTLKLEKYGLDGKLASLLTASKDLDNLIESQRSEKNKEGLGYTAVPPHTA